MKTRLAIIALVFGIMTMACEKNEISPNGESPKKEITSIEVTPEPSTNIK
jgi:hypothetical protein